uniref:Uncharacterized protein n=1 Tax=Steinernema glaseri TaxID=37863 RepID=A0A1I7Z4N7_9BILA
MSAAQNGRGSLLAHRSIRRGATGMRPSSAILSKQGDRSGDTARPSPITSVARLGSRRSAPIDGRPLKTAQPPANPPSHRG